MLQVVETIEFLLTHSLQATGPIPTAHDPDGIYPYQSFCETSHRPEIRKRRMITSTPSLGSGLYRVADPNQTPGIKLRTDGIGRDEAWVSQYTLDGAQCLEIQAGPLIDQSMQVALAPGERHGHDEFWIPLDCRRNLREIALPAPTLRPLGAQRNARSGRCAWLGGFVDQWQRAG